MNFDIERLHDGEADRLKSIRLAALRDAPDAFGTTWEESVARTAEHWSEQLAELPTFVATVGGADVGMVRGARDDEQKDAAWLISLWVAPAARGARVGEALVDAVVGWARAEGFARLLLDVGDHNAPAIALYARKGFEPTGEVGALPAPRAHVVEHRRMLMVVESE